MLPAAFADEPDTCLRCHGNVAATPPAQNTKTAPLLAEKFSADWVMYEFDAKHEPPLDPIPQPHRALRGTTHYDSTRQSMTEIYRDQCIDIFPAGRQAPCQFTSIRDKTYLMRFDPAGATCCQWSGKAFHAPRRDVVQNMAFSKSTDLGQRAVDTWFLDIPLPGPFGYGFVAQTNTPAVFWFPILSGWAQQNFHNFSATEPPAGAFDLIPACAAKPLLACE